jgi:hypothetical protein
MTAKANQVSIPYVDPSVQHVGVSRLRALNVAQLRDLDKTLVIQDNDKPLAVLLRYEHFLAMQEQILKNEQ